MFWFKKKGEVSDKNYFYNTLFNLLKNNNVSVLDKEYSGSASVWFFWEGMKYLYPNIHFEKFNEKNIPNAAFFWGLGYCKKRQEMLDQAIRLNLPVYLIEDGFLKSADTWVNQNVEQKYRDGVSFSIDTKSFYFDGTRPTLLEDMLNDKNLIITKEQKNRAKNCINKIIETHLTKYNHQPIFEPKIGRSGVKKVLVVDQSYGDMSISQGRANADTFKNMLKCAIAENPDADIIVKTHPDSLAGRGNGYFSGLKQGGNIYFQTDPINPISLIKSVDIVYVCTTQFGFEALLCGKEVHTFGVPFYAGWGLTNDRQHCDRRTNARNLEEIFYITYIMYCMYVNPIKKSRCEIEEAMDYLLDIRDEYFKEFNVLNEL